MRFLNRIRSGARKSLGSESKESKDHLTLNDRSYQKYPTSPPPEYDCTVRLPSRLLAEIFANVCPHSRDASYKSSEESMTDGACMLCDMRDLAHCALVCRRWSVEAQNLLYKHVRIDPVHYCELEIELAAKRKHRSFFDRNGEPIDAPKTRLMLFMRTVWESQPLATRVQSLRMPYMTREASKAELARTVSALPCLRYVDLPSGFYSDDASSIALKQELMARCPDIRRMRYSHGSEGSVTRIPGSGLWRNLEALELSSLNVETGVLRLVLASFPALQDLTLEDLPGLDDTMFSSVSSLPMFPAVKRLTIQNAPHMTAHGIVAHLSHPASRNALHTLALTNTGVAPHDLHQIISQATVLEDLSIVQDVDRSFPIDNIPLLSSRSLQTLHYEITAEQTSFGLQPVTSSYYTYLFTSLTSNNLPSLRRLYVRDASFPERLLSPPPRLFGGGEAGPQKPQTGLQQPLSLYSKGLDELEWNLTEFEASAANSGKRSSTTRPVSFHEAQLSASWGGEARKSIIVGNGFGGFLAVPVEEGQRPGSPGNPRQSRQNLWR